MTGRVLKDRAEGRVAKLLLFDPSLFISQGNRFERVGIADRVQGQMHFIEDEIAPPFIRAHPIGELALDDLLSKEVAVKIKKIGKQHRFADLVIVGSGISPKRPRSYRESHRSVQGLPTPLRSQH